MSAATATTIQGVSVLTRERLSNEEVFDIALSHQGIEIRRPGRAPARMSWNRVSHWEIEQQRYGVLLTLRGGGATTPLMVPGWNADELQALMRATAGDVDTPREPPRGNQRRWPALRASSTGKVVASVVLLGLLATAVALVLLQSAGVISWGFLGPTA